MSMHYPWEDSFIKEVDDYISLYCANRKHENLDIKVFTFTRPEFDKKRVKIHMSMRPEGTQTRYHIERVGRLDELYTTYTCVIDEMHSDLLRKVDEERYTRQFLGIWKAWNPMNIFEIKKVIFNDPATIVFWGDGKKTVVKCSEGDTFDPEKGLAMAFIKKHMGNDNSYHKIFKKWIPDMCTTNKDKETNVRKKSVSLNELLLKFRNSSTKRYPWGEIIKEDDHDSNATTSACSDTADNGDTSVEVGK